MIPQELIDNIVWEVGNFEDQKVRRLTLQACALTSWSFLAPSRKLLFQKIELQEDSGEDESYQNKSRSRLERFLEILQRDPSLEMEVKSLTIQLSFPTLVSKNGTQDPRRAALPTILSSLFHVNYLALTYQSFQRGRLVPTWGQLDAPLQEALVAFCSSRPITQLKLEGLLNPPITLITNCPNLTSLNLSGVVVTGFDPDSFHPGETVPVLESLTLYNPPISLLIFSQLMEQGMSHLALFNLSHLRDLKIRPPILLIFSQLMEQGRSHLAPFNLSQLRELKIGAHMLRSLKPHIPSVTHLTIICWNHHDFLKSNENFEYSLNGWRNLRVLEFKCNFARGESIGDLPLIQPAKYRSSDSPSERETAPIHTLKITAFWYNRTHANEMEPFQPSAGWTAIDSALSSTAFPSLRTIKLILCFRYMLDTSIPNSMAQPIRSRLFTAIRERLPQLFPSITNSSSVQVELELTVFIPSLGIHSSD